MTANSRDKTRHIFVSIQSNSVSRQELLRGVARFASGRNDWEVTLLYEEARNPADMANLIATSHIDGMVGNEDGIGQIPAHLLTDVPTVVIGNPQDKFPVKPRHYFIRLDNRKVGAFGADRLFSLGLFESFAFITATTHESWSILRAEGFFAYIRSRGLEPREFHDTGNAEELEEFIRKLPKPAAVMCAWDYLALKTINAARRIGVDVPRHMSVIGVDNDDTICEFTTPAISSISIPHADLGFAAAAMLDQIMRNRSPKAHVRDFSEGLRIFKRESAKPVVPATALIRHARKFINDNQSRRLTVTGIAHALGVSRQLLETRFRELSGTTVRDVLAQTRLAAAKRLLRETSRPINVVISASGGGNARHFMTFFRRHTGMTMSDYRRMSKG